MSQYADETYTIYQETIRKARKEHTCEACGETVKAGHTYAYIACLFDHSWTTIKRCARCQRVHEVLREQMGYYEWPDEYLSCGHDWEDLHEGEPPPELKELCFSVQGEVVLPVGPRCSVLVLQEDGTYEREWK